MLETTISNAPASPKTRPSWVSNCIPGPKPVNGREPPDEPPPVEEPEALEGPEPPDDAEDPPPPGPVVDVEPAPLAVLA